MSTPITPEVQAAIQWLWSEEDWEAATRWAIRRGARFQAILVDLASEAQARITGGE